MPGRPDKVRADARGLGNKAFFEARYKHIGLECVSVVFSKRTGVQSGFLRNGERIPGTGGPQPVNLWPHFSSCLAGEEDEDEDM